MAELFQAIGVYLIGITSIISFGTHTFIEKVRDTIAGPEKSISPLSFSDVQLPPAWEHMKEEQEFSRYFHDISSGTSTDPKPQIKSPSTIKNVPLPLEEIPTNTTPSLPPKEAPAATSTPILPAVKAPLPPVLPNTYQNATINILCSMRIGNTISMVTGSGVIIDPRGVIITNAHIAQYYLLPNYDCTIRTGSPAEPTYEAELLFVSKRWIEEHAKDITDPNPSGTGERDFALLLITKGAAQTPLPISFPFISIDTSLNAIKVGDSISLAAYPASFLSGPLLVNNLTLASTISSIREVLTFKTSTIDLFSTGGNILAQRGSSGGGVFSTAGKLVGVIVTTTEASTTGERDLRAITLSHIETSLAEETGKTINAYLSGNLTDTLHSFTTEKLPSLKAQF